MLNKKSVIKKLNESIRCFDEHRIHQAHQIIHNLSYDLNKQYSKDFVDGDVYEDMINDLSKDIEVAISNHNKDGVS